MHTYMYVYECVYVCVTSATNITVTGEHAQVRITEAR